KTTDGVSEWVNKYDEDGDEWELHAIRLDDSDLDQAFFYEVQTDPEGNAVALPIQTRVAKIGHFIGYVAAAGVDSRSTKIEADVLDGKEIGRFKVFVDGKVVLSKPKPVVTFLDQVALIRRSPTHSVNYVLGRLPSRSRLGGENSLELEFADSDR